MLTPAEIDHKVKQHDSDVEAIYEILTSVRNTQDDHTRRLDVLDAKVDRLTLKVDEHGAKLDEHGAKLDEHGAKLDRILQLLEDR